MHLSYIQGAVFSSMLGHTHTHIQIDQLTVYPWPGPVLRVLNTLKWNQKHPQLKL